MRFFNTAGPVNCGDHYFLPPLDRFNLDEILSLVRQKKYFVLHAPRQTGKTSCLLSLMDYLNDSGEYRSLYFNVEAAQGARENVLEAMKAILSEMASSALFYLKDDFIKKNWREVSEASAYSALGEMLSLYANESSLPLVIFIDEIDSLVGDTLISVLRQLRAGYTKRPSMFPQSIILCGVRDVRDYRIHSSEEKAIITGGSAFNIKAESLRLGDFNKEDVISLLKQHTKETGQEFEDEALNLVWELTEGQPWLVNALAYEACFKTKENRDRSIKITAEMIEQAKENIILRRDTHIDQLADKLQEPRIHRVISPILAGIKKELEEVPVDDLYYIRDLGLIKTDGGTRISNPIYREVIPRELTYTKQMMIAHQPSWYINYDGTLNMEKLIAGFQEFFRENSEHWIELVLYKEAGPQLLLQAFLQRIVNGGGRVEREYGLGRMRTDLLVIWDYEGGRQKFVIELKVLYKSLNQTIASGLKQTTDYMERCGTTVGYLIIFDRQKDKSWDEKIFRREEKVNKKNITIWGM